MLLFSRGFCSSHTMGCVSGAAGEGREGEKKTGWSRQHDGKSQ